MGVDGQEPVSRVGTASAPTSPGRRGVLSALLGGGVVGLFGILLYPVLRFIAPPPGGGEEASSVVAAKVGELPPNGSKIFRFGSKPALLLRTPGGELRAFTAVCTHLQCTVQYRSDLELIWCACHNGRFDLTGRNVAGPPPRPLDEFTVAVRGTDIVVSRAKA
jgi:Rieske Fe-S protein